MSTLADSIANHETEILSTTDLIATLLLYLTGITTSDDDEEGRYQTYELCKPVLLRLHAEDSVGFLRVARKLKASLGIPVGAIEKDMLLLAATQASVYQAQTPGPGGDHYTETPQGIFWHKPTAAGAVEIELCNFTARITADVARDDGVESRHHFELVVT